MGAEAVVVVVGTETNPAHARAAAGKIGSQAPRRGHPGRRAIIGTESASAAGAAPAATRAAAAPAAAGSATAMPVPTAASSVVGSGAEAWFATGTRRGDGQFRAAGLEHHPGGGTRPGGVPVGLVALGRYPACQPDLPGQASRVHGSAAAGEAARNWRAGCPSVRGRADRVIRGRSGGRGVRRRLLSQRSPHFRLGEGLTAGAKGTTADEAQRGRGTNDRNHHPSEQQGRKQGGALGHISTVPGGWRCNG